MGLDIEGAATAITATNVSGGNIHNNIISNNTAYGIDITANGGNTVSNFMIEGNTIASNSFDGVYVYGDASTISNFTISGNTVSGNFHGVYIYGVNSSTLSNFTISNNMLTVNDRGMRIVARETSTASQFLVSGNTIDGTGTAGYNRVGLFVYSTESSSSMSDFTVTGNTIKVQFDPAQLNELSEAGFAGFTPVIVNMTAISSTLPLPGIGQ